MEQLAATVNGSPIDNKALNAAMQSLAQENFHATLDEVPRESHAELEAMALERLIARELIFQAALAEGFVADEADVKDESSRILRMMGNPADFWKRLAERGMDEASFLRMVRKDVTVDQMSARKLADVTEPGEEEIRRFFSAYPDKLRDHERVRASHILIPLDPDDPDKALERAMELKVQVGQEGFSEIAKRHSVCASAPGGGELGFIRREDVDPTFAEAAFSQIVDELGAPVKTPYGYHLIKVTEHEIPAPPTLDEAHDKIVGFLKKASGSKLLQEWVAELRNGAKIEMLND
ncbi:MAG: peptidylprolyl isomerase [Deltaproteobacteria bacterium]|nr:peptidylprolyl isomerase [Deltaproteobacteria bacterium]